MTARISTVAAAVATAILAVGATSALAAPTFAPAEESGVRPGSQTLTEGGQCTSNFVFVDDAENRYIGQAAHCSATGTADETDGCEAGQRPLGTKVSIEGAREPGTMVYNSWIAMQQRGERDPNACQFNDLALIKLDPADHGNVNPTIPGLGGPAGVVDAVPGGATVFSYGNSSLRGGLDLLKPKRGFNLGSGGDGWTHNVLTLTPGIPGDSGSGFVDRQGRAFGVLSTLQLAPLAGTNGVSDLRRMLDYAREHADLDVRVADGTRGPAIPFFGL